MTTDTPAESEQYRRQLAVKWLSLTYGEQVDVAKSLDLMAEGDGDLRALEFCLLVFERASSRGVLDQLHDRVHLKFIGRALDKC